ncbi:MAG TPA: wax ester/triacylglycerol synthase family O-acyltransferase [Solirubrobacteraceae bacterium]
MSATEPLSALDATFLELEEADVTAHMHIGALLVFDPLPGGGTPTLARLRRHLERRLDELPRYRQRLSSRTTGGLHWPSWVPDERFDIAAHVTRAALPKPGGERELLAWAADFWSHRLDRGRPLWRMVLLQGLAGGRWALVTKTHHCLVDGMGSVDAFNVLLDPEPTPARRRRPRPTPVDGVPNTPGAARRLAGLPRAATEAAVDVLRHPRRAAEGLDSARALVELLVRDELVAAPKTSLNVPLSEHRRIAVTEVSLEEIKAIKRALGGTVNDVVLALVTAALRDLLIARGETPPAGGLRAMVPVNIRAATEQLELGNRVTSLFAHLPVSVPESRARFRRVRAETMRLKASHEEAGARLLVDLGALAPPVLHSVVARSLFATRLFNVTVTNVAGSPITLYAFGAPLRRIVPLVPLAAEHAVGIAALSYDGGVCFCVHADRDAVPDVDLIAASIAAEVEALGAVAEHAAAVAAREAALR